MKEKEKLFNRYITMLITQRKINCSHQILGTVFPLTTNTVIKFEDDIFQVTTILVPLYSCS
jgi:hypothetical protein